MLLIVCHCGSFLTVVVQSLGGVWLFATPWTAARQASLFSTISRSLFKLMSIDSVMPSNHLILCCPLLLLPSIFPSIRVFSNELALCIRWPKYCSFSIISSDKYSGLISFRIDRLDLLVVQVTPKSFLQHHKLKASTLWLSAFFMVQLSHPHMTTGKTIAWTIRILVGKVMSLLFHNYGIRKLPGVFLWHTEGHLRILMVHYFIHSEASVKWYQVTQFRLAVIKVCY